MARGHPARARRIRADSRRRRCARRAAAPNFAHQPNVAAIFLQPGRAPSSPASDWCKKIWRRRCAPISAAAPRPSIRRRSPRPWPPPPAPHGGLLTHAGFRGLYGDGIRAHLLPLSRLHHPVRAAAEFGRRHPVRDAAGAARLSAQGDGLSFQRFGSCADGGDASSPIAIAIPIWAILRSSTIRPRGSCPAPCRSDQCADSAESRHPLLRSRRDARPHDEKATTTHYSVVDRKGNAVSVTYTINDDFGAKVIAGDTGFFLNDEMDDFTAKPGAPNLFGLVQGKANAIAPGKRPLSSMTPTIVLKDGKPLLVVGTPGGSRIITTVLEIIVNVIDHGMTAAGGRRCAAHPSSMAARHAGGRTLRVLRRHGHSAHPHGYQVGAAGALGNRQCRRGHRHRARGCRCGPGSRIPPPRGSVRRKRLACPRRVGGRALERRARRRDCRCHAAATSPQHRRFKAPSWHRRSTQP